MPHPGRLALARARGLLSGGAAAAAAEALSGQTPPSGSEGAHALFQGIAACRSGDLAQAEQHFARVATFDAENRLAQNWRAVVLARRGDLVGALEVIEHVGLVPYNELLTELALIFENHLLCHPERRPPTGLDADALRAMAAGDLSAAPPPRKLGLRALERAWMSGDHATLLAHAKHMLLRAPDEPDGAHLLTLCLLDSGLSAEALELAERTDAKFPGNPFILSQLGLAAVRAGDVGRALLALSRVEVEGPEDYNCHWNLGLAALRAGNEGEARWFFTKALRDYFIGSFEESWSRLWRAVTSEHFRK